MRIAVVCYPSVGGSGIVASELAIGLARRGHEVHLLSTGIPGRGGDDAVTYHPIDVPRYPLFEHAPYGMAVAGAVINLARRTPLDILHVHYAVPHATSALLVRQTLGAAAPRTVVTLHGSDVTRLGSHPSLHALLCHALATADGITTPSSYLQAEAARVFELPAARIERIPNFVDTVHFAPPAVRDRQVLFPGPGEGPILAHVSNLRPVKRPVDLVEALVRVRQTVPARLVIVGDGPERVSAAARAEALGVGGHVRFLGARTDFAPLLGHADGFVMTSESESFGVAALEALSAGVPVFGYRVGGLPDVVGEAGTLVPFADLDALGAAIVRGLADPSLRVAARARAVTHFRDEPAILRYEAYFQHVLDRGSR
jgi:L-malate glycosyltransferase